MYATKQLLRDRIASRMHMIQLKYIITSLWHKSSNRSVLFAVRLGVQGILAA